MSMLITDPSQPDNPIIFANRAFHELTQYEPAEVTGRNCRFLQGPDTDPDARAQLRAAIEREEDVHLEILNYRRDGAAFWNSLFVSPVRDASGEVVYFFASQLDVTGRRLQLDEIRRLNAELARAKAELESEVAVRTEMLLATLGARTQLLDELDHRVKNNIQLMISLVNLEKRQRESKSERQALDLIGLRLHALGLVHRHLYDHGIGTEFAVGEFVRDIVADLQLHSGRTDLQVEFDVDGLAIPASKAAPLALLVNELFAAALRFAYQGRGGRPKLTVQGVAGDRLELSLTDDAYTQLEKETVQASAGGAIVSSLARQLDATVDWRDADPQALVSVTLPRTEAGAHAQSR